MYRIEIYYNKKGELTFAQYDENDNLLGRCHGKNVKKCLDAIKDEKIKTIYPNGKDTATITYNDASVNIHHIDHVTKDPLMKDYLKIIEKKLEQKEERASKVTRKNKYRGPLVFVTTLLVLAFASAIMSGATMAPEAAQNSGKPTSSYSENYDKESKSPDISTDVPIFEAPIVEDDIPEYTFLEYEDRSDEEKLHTASTLYFDKIEKYADMYGLDPELVLALATQERGIHSSEKDAGGATGLMQIQNGIWLDNEVTAYNFNTNSYETVKVTKSKIENVDTNIKIGCMILQDMIHDKDYNILAGVLSYNMGGTNVNKILKKHSEETGISRADILANQNNCDWLKHRGIITVGDKDYVQHVISYMGSDIDTYVIKPNGERVDLSIKNYDVTLNVTR
ncbi:MAG: hypothetical protein E7162_04315 [Firmicutes bacterium]|nr:hypothetical protein [Bacillota bacterium]